MPPYRCGHPPRLAGWDYANAGAYFITVTVQGRLPVLRGAGKAGALTHAGAVVEDRWRSMPDRFATVRPDTFVVMPDHVHGILWLGMKIDRSEEALMNQGPTPGRDAFPSMRDTRITLGKVVRAWKAECTRAIRQTTPAFRWQSRYYETVIRNDRALREIRRYIRDNPLDA